MDGVAWLVQVSDLHFSRFAGEHEQLAKFGDKVRRGSLSAVSTRWR